LSIGQALTLFRGGKVAMAFALNPALPTDMLSRLVVVDISPAVGPVSPEFRRYINAMKEIDHAKVKTKKEGEEIMKKYEPVSVCNYKCYEMLLLTDRQLGGFSQSVFTP
jgi:hypothetical protein